MLANTLVQFAEDDWLNDSEAQMQAEDAQWLAARDRHQTEFAQLRLRALDEIATGGTMALFDEIGE